MKRCFWIPVVCGLIVAGCSKNEPASPVSTPQPAAQTPAASPATETVKSSVEAAKVAVTTAPAVAMENVNSNQTASSPAAPADAAASTAPVTLKTPEVPAAVPANIPSTADASAALPGLTNEVQQVLVPAIQSAVAQLGQSGGFLNNPNVRIPMPEQLQSVEKVMRGLGKGQVADQVIASVNHAAEAAVPVAGGVLTNAALQLKTEDVKGAMTNASGTNATTSLTQLFRQKAEPQLTDKIQPMVKTALDKTGAGAACQQLLDKSSLNPFSSTKTSTNTPAGVDSFITTKTLDGLFKVVAEKETLIRQGFAAKAVK